MTGVPMWWSGTDEGICMLACDMVASGSVRATRGAVAMVLGGGSCLPLKYCCIPGCEVCVRAPRVTDRVL